MVSELLYPYTWTTWFQSTPIAQLTMSRLCVDLRSTALSEMEGVLKSVVKERKGKDFSQPAFVDALLKANLTERQVNYQRNTCTSQTGPLEDHWYFMHIWLRAESRLQFVLTFFVLFLQVMEDSMVFTLAGSVITANCESLDHPVVLVSRPLWCVTYILHQSAVGVLAVFANQILRFLYLHTFPVCIWAVHFLSTSEEVQEKLYRELEEVLGKERLSLENISKLT